MNISSDEGKKNKSLKHSPFLSQLRIRHRPPTRGQHIREGVAGPFSGPLVAHRGLGVLRYPPGQAHGIFDEPGPERTSSETRGGRDSVPSHRDCLRRRAQKGRGQRSEATGEAIRTADKYGASLTRQSVTVTPGLTEPRLASLHAGPGTAPGIHDKETAGQVPREV